MTKLITILICAVAALTACGKKGSSGTTVATVAYYQSDNTCYDRKTNESVDMSKCDNVTHYLQFGSCIEKKSGNSVDISLCLNFVNQYYFSENSCLDKNNNNQNVDQNKCLSLSLNDNNNNNTSSSRFYKNGPICYDRQTGGPTDPILCSGKVVFGKMCKGTYIDTYYGYPQQIACHGADCSGYLLFNQTTNKYVLCE